RVLRPLVFLGALVLGTSCGTDEGGPTDEPLTLTRDVTPDGGELVLADGTALIVPAGALRETTTITITAVPDDDVYLGGLVLEPEGLVLQKPALVQVPLPASWPADEQPVVFETWGPEAGEAIDRGDFAAVSNGKAELEVEHFSCGIAALNCHSGTIRYLLDQFEARGCDRDAIITYVNNHYPGVSLSESSCKYAQPPELQALLHSFFEERGGWGPGVPAPMDVLGELSDAVDDGREVVLLFGPDAWPSPAAPHGFLPSNIKHSARLTRVGKDMMVDNTLLVRPQLREKLHLGSDQLDSIWPLYDLDSFRELQTGVPLELLVCQEPGCLGDATKNPYDYDGFGPLAGIDGSDERCDKPAGEACVSRRGVPWRAVRAYVEKPGGLPASLCESGQPLATFPDPSGDWTFSTKFQAGVSAIAEVHDDTSAYNDQWVEITLAGYPTEPSHWYPVKVEISASGIGKIDYLRLYSASNNWDPASRNPNYQDFAPGTEVTLDASHYYWLYLYIDDPEVHYDYTMQIFHLAGDT
ncbi:MAG: hypothetical protein KC731_18665, partial [Myxococcales bacterium]|nr:hypothetical protein [Myxococcales bacterium]